MKSIPYKSQDMKKLLTCLLLFASLTTAFATPPTTIKKTLSWEEKPVIHSAEGSESFEIWQFEGAVYDADHPSLPYFSERFPVNSNGRLSVEIVNVQYEAFDKTPSPDDAVLSDRLHFITTVDKDRRKYFGNLRFIPIRKVSGKGFERVVSFELRISFTPLPEISYRGGGTFTSVLSDGDIYKFAVTETGVHKLDFSFLKDELGIPIGDIDPKTIKLYGNGGGMLPEPVSAFRYDDLVENAIQVVGEEDGNFDSGDYILFYGEGASKWFYNKTKGEFNHPENFHDTKNYYFIKISAGTGKRISSKASASGSTFTTTTFDERARFEEDRVNLLHDWSQGQGSGRKWYGDLFKLQTTPNIYDDQFDFPDIVPNSPVKITASFAGRIFNGSAGWMEVVANGTTFKTDNFSTTKGGATDPYANTRSINSEFNSANGKFNIAVTFRKSGASSNNQAWLDYIELNFKRKLIMAGDQFAFRDTASMYQAVSTFQLSSVPANVVIWDISDPLDPVQQEINISGTELSFSAETQNEERPKEFIAFNETGSFFGAEAGGKIENQNIHGIDGVDFVIIYNKEFSEQAMRLAQHRANLDDISVVLVDIDQLFNEFSSGRKDVTAVRDFAKLLFDRTDQFKYLLLFGDGSYDLRNLNKQGNDFIPAFETVRTLSPIQSYPSDDYFALLNEGEGGNIESGSLDIAVGRLPVKTAQEAEDVVNKIVNYDTNPVTLGDWRNRIVFVGDDQDNNRHTGDSDEIAERIGGKNKNLNIDKIYIDAFPQISTPGGTRVPLATDALNSDMFKGVLAVTYLGHGGSKGWAQERILKINDILAWENKDKLPIFITATCSFSGFDDPGFTTAGEEVLLNKRGGAIALFTTVRSVYASSNKRLTRAAIDTLFFKFDNKIPPIGEVLRVAKNQSGASLQNSRKFLLLGDPSMRLALPNYSIATTKINGEVVQNTSLDTIKALQKVSVEGEIQDDFGNRVNTFNGTIFPTIFDKKVTVQTLGQDSDSPIFSFFLQKNILFKGRASVKNGAFQFTFVVPKDINYQFGKGKISYYASDLTQLEDASGSFEGFTVGGTDPNAVADDKGPKVDVFLNSEDFVFGGITNENPVLLVKLEDDNGINVIGNSIGHDLSGILDKDSKNTFILNDFYEAALDDFTKGEARFPLSKLAEGRHEVKITAWDIANNSSEGFTEFIVASSEELALKQVLNYPNPFTTSTCFMFEHNFHGQELDVLIHIYTVSGRLVKTLEERIFSEGDRLSRENCLRWDGRDDYGDPLAKGIYLYKVKVRSVNTGNITLEGQSDFEKLVILK